jgi:acetyltransferase-like isoleucine patch superfamily enzyme
MSRVTDIWARYGWRTPFVVSALLGVRSRALEDNLRWLWLGLSTKGVKGRRIRGGRAMEITPGAHFSVGDDVSIGARCVVEVSVNPLARLEVGSDTWISHDCHICSCGSIRIGSDVLIGEFVSIRDSSHRFRDAGTRIKLQGDRIGSILIENDVWIGRGAIVLGREEGLTVGQGAVIGANSVVRDSVPAFAIVAGSPAKLIGMRQDC